MENALICSSNPLIICMIAADTWQPGELSASMGLLCQIDNRGNGSLQSGAGNISLTDLLALGS